MKLCFTLHMTAIAKAIDHIPGGVATLAERLNVSTNFIYQMRRGVRPVPAHHCLEVEKACGAVVSRYDLRPDVFGEPSEAA